MDHKLKMELEKLKIKYDKLENKMINTEYEKDNELTKLKNENSNLKYNLNLSNISLEKAKVTNKVLIEENKDVKKNNQSLKEENENLKKENLIFREKLQIISKKTSKNSNTPSSAEIFKKTPQNNRVKSDKKLGGQLGHKGYTLEQKEPTSIKYIKVDNYCNCGGKIVKTGNFTKKQLIDFAIEVITNEERCEEAFCDKCGQNHTPKYSKEYINPVQYGNNVKSFCTILSNEGMVSINRISTILSEITKGTINVSHSSIVNFNSNLATKLESLIEYIKSKLIESKVLHVDETGYRFNKTINWFHVYCNNLFTYYGANTKRGKDAIDDIDILETFINILVHDHFKTYYKYKTMTHAECNAHILRYLKAIIEILDREWAKKLFEYLIKLNNLKKEKMSANINTFTNEELAEYKKDYLDILENGFKEYSTYCEKVNFTKTQALDNERCLLTRLKEYSEQHLLFINNFEVPFSNNQAEKDLRMIKVKSKVSGCYRGSKGAEHFANIRSFISTLKKQDLNIFENIFKVFNNEKVILKY